MFSFRTSDTTQKSHAKPPRESLCLQDSFLLSRWWYALVRLTKRSHEPQMTYQELQIMFHGNKETQRGLDWPRNHCIADTRSCKTLKKKTQTHSGYISKHVLRRAAISPLETTLCGDGRALFAVWCAQKCLNCGPHRCWKSVIVACRMPNPSQKWVLIRDIKEEIRAVARIKGRRFLVLESRTVVTDTTRHLHHVTSSLTPSHWRPMRTCGMDHQLWPLFATASFHRAPMQPTRNPNLVG